MFKNLVIKIAKTIGAFEQTWSEIEKDYLDEYNFDEEDLDNL